MNSSDNNEEDEARAYLAAIVDSSDEAIIGKTLDGVITAWNASAVRMFGYTADEAIGQHIGLIIPEDRQDEEFVIIGKVKRGIRVDHFETVRRAKDGGEVHLSITVSPILNSAGRIIGASKVARDITAQKTIEAALAESTQRRDEFLANMSHELRTPLNAVIGLAHILGASERLNPKEQQCVSLIKQSGDTLLALINNLLDFSRLESGALVLEKVPFDLPELVEKVVTLHDMAVRDKGLSLNVTYAGALKDTYIGDPLRLQQVLTNLVSNAIKFTAKGQVDITVALRRDDLTSSVLCFEVADTGIGIAPAAQAAIFDKFTQADASTTRTHGGSGLGLAITRSIVEAMGGTISVSSTPGLGSTFRAEVRLGNSAGADLLRSHVEEPQAHKNVLVVDDYEPNIFVVSSMLERMGYSYDVAHNGMEAVRRAERGQYDVILMDVQMPGMDGFESTRRIRSREAQTGSRRACIVAMTAHVFERDKHLCLEAGMDDFIPKPFDPVRLEDVFSRLIVS